MIYVRGTAAATAITSGTNIFNNATIAGNSFANPFNSPSMTLNVAGASNTRGLVIANPGTYQITFGAMYLSNTNALVRASIAINGTIQAVWGAVDTNQQTPTYAAEVMNSLTVIIQTTTPNSVLSIVLTTNAGGVASLNTAFSASNSVSAYITAFRLQ
jgi:hypothetical protein